MPTREQLIGNIEAMESQGASQSEIQGYLDSQGSQKQPDKSPEPTKKRGIFGRIAERTKATIGRRVEKLGETVFDRGKEQTFLETGLQVAGNIVGTAGEVAFGAVAEIPSEEFKEKIVSTLGIAAPLIEPISAKLDELKESNPRLYRNLAAALEVSEVLPVGKGMKVASEVAETAVRTTVRGARVAEEVVSASMDARKVARTAKISEDIDRFVGTVAQGKKADIPKVRSALETLDTTGVKTFDDLSSVSNEKIKFMSEKQNELLAKDPTPKGLSEFDKTVTKGDKSVTTNPVSQAMDDLEELYTKTNEPDNLVRVQDLKERAKTGGLTLVEVNDISKEYGTEFGSKAFSKKTGEALTSVNAQKFENTRKAVKQSFRDKLPDDASKALDREMSSLFTVNRLSRDMAEKANSLLQKVKSRGLIERVSRATGLTINALTGGGAKAFIAAFLPSNIGNKVMNSLDLQEKLSKNLSKIDKMLQMSDDSLERAMAKQFKTK